MRGECVLNIYVHKELFPERFPQVLKNMTGCNNSLNSWTEDVYCGEENGESRDTQIKKDNRKTRD